MYINSFSYHIPNVAQVLHWNIYEGHENLSNSAALMHRNSIALMYWKFYIEIQNNC